jgi:hypothetical protein
MHCCESTPLWLEEAHTKGLKRFKESVHTLRVFPSKGIGKTGNEIGARIQEYIRRNLSQDSDALNAFLGIFQAFRELQHPIYHHWGLPLSKGRSMKQELEGLHTSFLSSLAWSMSSCDNSSAHLLTRRDMFPSWSWAAWKDLSDFSQKSIAEILYSPSVSFRTYRGQLVGLEEFKTTLGRRDSTVVFDPYVYLAGWVTTVRFVQDDSNKTSTPGFHVSWPVPTRRVTVILDAKTAPALRQKLLIDSFQVLLLGSESTCGDEGTPPDGLKNVHGIILQPGPRDTHKRLGVVTWTRLGKPTFDDRNNVMRVKELLEARRISTQCSCGCTPLSAAPFEQYVEDPHNVVEFTKVKIKLV